MPPFKLSSVATQLVQQYPSADTVRDALRSMPAVEREGFLRLWISEGIPFAFRDRPMVYELLRQSLGQRLRVHPKSFTIVGSARMGYSLAPAKYGRQFDHGSDLDFVAVEVELFEGLEHTFKRWSRDWESGAERPLNPSEEGYWKSNLEETPGNLARGFINSWRLPNRDAYPLVQSISQTLFVLCSRLLGSARRKATLRVYRDWNAFTDQVSRTLAQVATVSTMRTS